MSTDLFPHVDGSGRGLDDGECIHCGTSGSLADWECPVRLRTAFDRTRAVLEGVLTGAIGPHRARTRLEADVRADTPARDERVWPGGDNPAPGARVGIRLRNGTVGVTSADGLLWGHVGRGGDIVAWWPAGDGDQP